MSFANNASRFDFLPDDAGDPFETASKKNKKKSSGGGSGDAKKKAGAKTNTNSDRKQLQSLAFGSASEGKKKSKGSGQAQTQQNGTGSSSSSNASASSSTREPNPEVGVTANESKPQRNGNSSEKNANLRPKGMSKEQWENWQKRDADIMDETYASELQAALLKSKIEYETEQKNKPVAGKGKKKKPIAVPLTEFNARLNEPGASTVNTNIINGNFMPSAFGGHTYQLPQPSEEDEELVERFRMEARLELERERQKALQQQILMSRQPPPPIARPTPISATSLPSPGAVAVTPSAMGDKDLLISRLTEENLRLKGEIELLKDRVKTINNYLQAAQEVKDKAKLVYELDTMTKANNDLNEELRQVHSQLEQERSRSGAAMSELRRLLENRRRTTTEGSNGNS